MSRSIHGLWRAAFFAAILLAPCVRATVTNVVWYRLGENDPGATAGGVAVSTKDLIGSVNLPLNAGPHYSADVASAAAAHAGSALSMQFSTNQWGTNSVLSGIVNNFGLEVWVKISTVATNSVLAYNGHTGTSGWGLIQVGTNYYALFGGIIVFGAGAATSNVWTHVALVRDNGLSTLYVNGVAAGTHPGAPNGPAGRFGIGAPPQNPIADFLNGWLDEVRVFTFAPGQFSTNDLLLKRGLVVTTLADGGPGSLRTLTANAAGGDIITFATNGTINLTSGELLLTNSLQIAGPGPASLSISGGGSNRLFNASAGVTNVFSGLTIRDGFGSDDFSGGGIYNAGTLSLSNCVVSFCSAAKGPNGNPAVITFPVSTPATPGGVGKKGAAIVNIGTISLLACTFHHNTAGTGGKGADATLQSFTGTAGGNGGDGGALFNSGTAALYGCTFYTNFGGAGGGSGTNFFPPGITGGTGGSYGVIYNTGVMTLTLGTVDGNPGGPGGPGGSSLAGPGPQGPPGAKASIFNSGTITFIASTVTHNAGGGVHSTMFATARSSLFALNLGATAPDYLGSFSSQGHNLIGNNDGSFGFFPGTGTGDIVGTITNQIDPLIAPLANYGGLTLTVKLLAGSPALDSGDDSIQSLVLTDQRGQSRKSGAHVDIGAYEVVLGVPTLLTSAGMDSDRVFHFGFTNVPAAEFTILTTTNVSLPMNAWTVLGPPIETVPGQFQFLSAPQTNDARRFYRIRSP